MSCMSRLMQSRDLPCASVLNAGLFLWRNYPKIASMCIQLWIAKQMKTGGGAALHALAFRHLQFMPGYCRAAEREATSLKAIGQRLSAQIRRPVYFAAVWPKPKGSFFVFPSPGLIAWYEAAACHNRLVFLRRYSGCFNPGLSAATT